MMNCQPCKTAGTPKACQYLAWRYLHTMAPIGSELVLLITLEMLLWTA